MKQSVLAVVLCMFTGVVFAAGSGPYVGLNIGQSSTDTLPLSDKTATGVGAIVGYQFGPHFGVEVQYLDFGSVTFNSGSSSDMTGYGLSVVGTYPFNNTWSAFLKIGATHTTIKSVGTYGNVDRCNGSWGIGGQYNINPSLGVRLSYESYGVGAEGPLDSAKTSLTAVGVIYRF